MLGNVTLVVSKAGRGISLYKKIINERGYTSMNFIRMLTLLLFSICFVILPMTSEADTFTVNSTIDDVDSVPGDGDCASGGGLCTLRAAIQEANALVGADTILLKAKKYYLTIAGADEDAAATGDLDITDDLKIKGVSSAQTIINGGALDRVFHINGPFIVTFVNLSIQNGFVQEGGGGIYNSLGTVSLVSCSVANNVTSGSIGAGGGIFSIGDGSSLNINSSSVTNNMIISSALFAFGGGIAVFNGGTLNISASKIAYNSASSADVAAGGGIVSFEGTGVTITNSKVLANSTISFPSFSEGGGIALLRDSTAAVIRETNISMNSSTSSSGTAYGGGLYFESETATVSTCTIKGNRVNAPASNGLGGGMAGNMSNITIKNASTIVSNLASFDGGGIKDIIGSTITVSPNSTVVNNMPNNQN